jgi:hypothetical protein
MQTKYLSITIEGAGSVTIDDAAAFLNRTECIQDIRCILFSMVGRFYHGDVPKQFNPDSYAHLHRRLRASKAENHKKQWWIEQHVTLLEDTERELLEAKAEIERLRGIVACSHQHSQEQIDRFRAFCDLIGHRITADIFLTVLEYAERIRPVVAKQSEKIESLRANQIPAPYTAEDFHLMRSQWAEIAAALHADPDNPDEVIRRASWPACPKDGGAPIIEGTQEARSVDAVIHAIDDETMLAEMEAEDAARPTGLPPLSVLGGPAEPDIFKWLSKEYDRQGLDKPPVNTEAIIADAAKILPDITDTEAARMHDALTADVRPVPDPVEPHAFNRAAATADAAASSLRAIGKVMSAAQENRTDPAAVTTADGVTVPAWTVADRVRLCDLIQRYHYLPPLDEVLQWTVAQCDEADKWLRNIRDPAPAHVFKWELPF